MLSLKQTTKDAIPIAMTLDNNQMIYYSPKPKIPSEDDITEDDLIYTFGKTPIRNKRMIPLLKRELIEKIKRGRKSIEKVESSSPTLMPFPNIDPHKRTFMFVTGPGGSGKTTFSLNMGKIYQDYFDKKIYIVTGSHDARYDEPENTHLEVLNIKDLVGNDEATDVYMRNKIIYKNRKKDLEPEERIEAEIALEKLKPKKGEYSTTPLLEEIKKDSFFIFDDWEALPDKAVFLMNYLVQTGRKDGVDLLICSHLPTNGAKLRALSNQLGTSCVTFFKTTLPRSIDYLLSKYLGFDLHVKSMINELHKDLDDRGFITIDTANRAIITPTQVKLF